MIGQLALLVAGLLTTGSHRPASAVLFAPASGGTSADAALVARTGTTTASIAREGTLATTIRDAADTISVAGSTAQPLIRIQSPAPGQVSGTFMIQGYAVDLSAPSGPGIDTVHVWAYPAAGPPFFVGVASYGELRTDVGDAFGPQFAESGFSLSATLPPGTYVLAAAGRSTVSGTFAAVATVTVTVPVPRTEVHVDVPTRTVLSAFTVGGWAIDPSASSGTGIDAVHVWAFPASGGSPTFLGATTTFFDRPDVAAARGARFLMSGFNVSTNPLPAGDYQVNAYARSV